MYSLVCCINEAPLFPQGKRGVFCYIFKKLRGKYVNIKSDIPSALNGYKRSEKLSDDHPEKNALINLLNKYRKILSRDDLQLSIFTDLYLNKYISDVFTPMRYKWTSNKLDPREVQMDLYRDLETYRLQFYNEKM